MEKNELDDFLELLMARSKSFAHLKNIQTEISGIVKSAGQGKLSQLSSSAGELFKELEQQKTSLSPFLKKWEALSKKSRETLLNGKIGKLIAEIEKNAEEITRFHQSQYEFHPSNSTGSSSGKGSLSERINLSR